MRPAPMTRPTPHPPFGRLPQHSFNIRWRRGDAPAPYNHLATPVTSPPPLDPIRARASASGSLTTAMCQPFACRSVPASRMTPTWPFQNTRSPRTSGPSAETANAERRFLQVAVARRGDPGGRQRRLNEPRTVDPFRRPSAPEIGRVEEALRDRDEVRFAAPRSPPDGAPRAKNRRRCSAKSFSMRATERRASSNSATVRGQPDRGTRIDVGAQRRDPVRRRNRRPERDRRQVADVAVALQLDPRPAFALVVDRDLLAEQRLRASGASGAGSRRTGRARVRHLQDPALDVAPLGHAAAKFGRGEVGRAGARRRSKFSRDMGTLGHGLTPVSSSLSDLAHSRRDRVESTH